MGLDLGFEQVGLTPTLANEIDSNCCNTIHRNRPAVQLIAESISDLTGNELRRLRNYDDDVYMMIGGPPCQSFSSGGNRLSLKDARGNLIYEYLRLINEVRPQYFVLENVANITTAAIRHRPISKRPGKHWNLKQYDNDHLSGNGSKTSLEPDEQSGSAIRKLLKDMSYINYHFHFGVLDAADYGAPQHRLRFFIVGSRDFPAPPFTKPTHGSEEPQLTPYSTVREAIYHMRNTPGPGSEYTPAVRRFFAMVPEGGNWRDLPVEVQEEALGGSWKAGGGKTGFYRRLSWNTPSPTITGRANRKGSALCHPEAVRPISVRECAALQGFPEHWSFHGSMNAQYMQIGNAVPIPLGRAVALSFLNFESNVQEGESAEVDYDEMLNIAVARLRATARNKRQRQKS